MCTDILVCSLSDVLHGEWMYLNFFHLLCCVEYKCKQIFASEDYCKWKHTNNILGPLKFTPQRVMLHGGM